MTYLFSGLKGRFHQPGPKARERNATPSTLKGSFGVSSCHFLHVQ